MHMIKNPEVTEVPNGTQWSSPTPKDNKSHQSLTYASREILRTHGQRGVCFFLAPPSSWVCPCLPESWSLSWGSFHFLQPYSIALHWWMRCFQLFVTLNKVAMHDLEWYTWASKSRGWAPKSSTPVDGICQVALLRGLTFNRSQHSAWRPLTTPGPSVLLAASLLSLCHLDK